MSLEPSSRAVEKARHPMVMALAVVGIVFLAATAYTFSTSWPGPADGRSVEAPGRAMNPVSSVAIAGR